MLKKKKMSVIFPFGIKSKIKVEKSRFNGLEEEHNE